MKPILISVIVFSILLLGGCMTTEEKTGRKTKTVDTQTMNDVRKIAWNSLSKSERKEVIGDWEEVDVGKTVVDAHRFFINDRPYEGKEVTVVSFRSKNSAILGDIHKLVDEKSQKVISGAYRD